MLLNIKQTAILPINLTNLEETKKSKYIQNQFFSPGRRTCLRRILYPGLPQLHSKLPNCITIHVEMYVYVIV